MPKETTNPQALGPLLATTPSYSGHRPASPRASAAARGSSRKVDTKCEVALRRLLWAAGYRFRKNLRELPGRPDIVFTEARLAVFCDGDFWHGRNWETRSQKLAQGTNLDYWLAKIRRNMERDQQNAKQLEEMGWTVLRLWETQILSNARHEAEKVIGLLNRLGHLKQSTYQPLSLRPSR